LLIKILFTKQEATLQKELYEENVGAIKIYQNEKAKLKE
jgi:hypothetical protein